MNRSRWLIPVAIIAGLVILVVFPLVGAYNNLVSREATVDQSFADLDTQLQRRNDLIPNLVEAVEGAFRQEQAVFVEIARARARYGNANTLEERAEADADISSALSRLLVIVENNPQLQSNRQVENLMTQLEGTENRVGQARRDYNEAATGYNVNIRQFPRNIIAGMLGFERKPLFEAEEADREAPGVDLDDAFTPSPDEDGEPEPDATEE